MALAAPRSVFARKREAARTAILEATSQIVAEKGVDSFTISEVARRAQINRALIYHYFKSRDNLVVEAIDHIVSRYGPIVPEAAIDAIERTTRMHIEHPEIARFFFQMLLTGRPLPGVARQMRETIRQLERLQHERAPHSKEVFDPTFVILIITLAQLSWAFSRREMARLLGMSLEEADDRFIAQLKRAGERALKALHLL